VLEDGVLTVGGARSEDVIRVQPDGSGVSVLLSGVTLDLLTVHDDGTVDTLFGDGGTDWFFARLSSLRKNKVKDLEAGKTVTGR
jgi:hypothetical protein